MSLKETYMSLLQPGPLVAPLELLTALDQLYPPRCPDPNDSEREIWMKAGERRLLEVLWSKHHDFHGT